MGMRYLQTIQTKYLGPTTYKGSRISASCAAGSIIVSWDHDLSAENNHLKAAMDLKYKLGWDIPLEQWRGGVLKNGTYVFVAGEAE